ncbi:MAG: YihY/virulence factor BrkB family protein [Proteobacteria bacterium]|nr:YihY/virulence factor BrkB family protein [Pseudomonadota bacterium]MBU1716207.1 YihY/virulence factor BrkB family protein [Pseudomonadota bacterium]
MDEIRNDTSVPEEEPPIHQDYPPQPTRREQLAKWIWATPTAGEHKFLNFIRAVLRIHLIVYQEFLADRIPLRASALTFTVILSMVPVLALGTAVLKGLGAGGQMRQAAHTFIEQLELTTSQREVILLLEQPAETADQSAENPELTEPTSVESAQDKKELSATLTTHLKIAVDMVFDYVDRTNFAALGIFGILALLIAVFSVLYSIEQAMNAIWQTRSGRSHGRKLMDYLALMLLLPITINLGVATMATLKSPALLAWLQSKLPWIGPQHLNLIPILALVATFTILYSFLPNTKVKISAALTGGFFGGIIWILSQALYFKMQIGVARYNAMYGSFATFPLFLIWIYVGWMIFLGGAEISFAVQIWPRYLWKKLTLTPINRLGLAFEIVAHIAADYQENKITTRDNLMRTLKQPDAYIKGVLTDLTRSGILRQVKDQDKGYVPAAPLENLSSVEIGELILGGNTSQLPNNNPAVDVLKAIRATLTNKKIVSRQNITQPDPSPEPPELKD